MTSAFQAHLAILLNLAHTTLAGQCCKRSAQVEPCEKSDDLAIVAGSDI